MFIVNNTGRLYKGIARFIKQLFNFMLSLFGKVDQSKNIYII